MIVTLKDGSKKEYAEAKSVIDIAYDISEGLARAACAGEVNGEVVDLRTVIDSDCELNILTAKDEKGLAVLRHTASHVLAQAVQTLFPDAKVAIGPSIDTGFYYDFDCPPFSRDDLDAIEKEMKKIIKKGAKIERFTKSREDAIAYFQEKNEPYKVELIEDLPEGSEISFYSQGDWTDLCAGPHLMSVKGGGMEQIAQTMEQDSDITSLNKEARSDLKHYYQTDDRNIDGYFFYKAASPMAVEEICIMKATDNTQANTLLENANAHLSGQKQVFEGYGTDQMALLNNAVVGKKGNYVYYMCGADAQNWRTAFLSMI